MTTNFNISLFSRKFAKHFKKNVTGVTAFVNTYIYNEQCMEISNLKTKIKLLEEENKVLRSNKNIGEKDEILLIQKLYNLNYQKKFDQLVNIFGQSAEEGITIINLNTDSPYKSVQDIKKANTSFKADFCILFNKTNCKYYPSIKSGSGANYAILNHTPRNAKIFNSELKNQLNGLDKLIGEYINKINKKQIVEDINILKLK